MAKKTNEDGVRLKAIRKKLNLRQWQLGEKLSVHQATIAMIERGVNNISSQIRSGLIEKLRVNPAYIDKGVSPIVIPDKTEISIKEREFLLSQIEHLKNALEDKNKIIALYEKMNPATP